MLPISEALLREDAYPHAVSNLHLVETHLSWVFLTGDYVYKVKKPVKFDFVDFSSATKRHFFCEEEVRCNRKFAPQLYLGVASIVEDADGGLRVVQGEPKGSSTVVEHAVCMRQFDERLQADRLLERGQLDCEEMRQFGRRLATQHHQLPQMHTPYAPGEAITDNFTTLRSTKAGQQVTPLLTQLETHARSQLVAFDKLLEARLQQHFVRECHGDLHLSNLARLEDGLTAFDCLEFDEDLRHIDFWCDSGFLFMDCCVRGREDLAYAFVDGYLDESGDYDGLPLLPLFADYRSVVRAKIAALRYEQTNDAADRERMHQHLNWSLGQQSRPIGKLWVTCGLSGSGKSYWADRLVSRLPALRLRSDILRKQQHGLGSRQSSASAVGDGLYTSSYSVQVYEGLAQSAVSLLQLGENVIIDAACLFTAQRKVLYDAAKSIGAAVELLYCHAPESLLRERISHRQALGEDPSEADGAVLDWQLSHFEPPDGTEPVVMLDTQTLELDQLLTLLG